MTPYNPNSAFGRTAYVCFDSWAGRTQARVTILKECAKRSKVRFDPLREAFDLMAEEQDECRRDFIRRYAEATGFQACGYCEKPILCHEEGCWREKHTEMSL